MTDRDRCASVQAVTTLWLDRRLSAAARADVERHVRECADCRAEYRAQARLAQAVAQLPREAPAADVVARAWRAARGASSPALPNFAGSFRAGRIARGAAAAAVLLTTALGGYWLGLERGARRAVAEFVVAERTGDGPVTPAPHDAPTPAAPAPHEAPAPSAELGTLRDVGEAPVADEAAPSREPTDASLAYRRAAHLVLADLATIDRIEPALRQPLLAAQMRAFGLDAWAARPASGDDPDASLLPLLRQLDGALTAKDDARLLSLQSSLRATPIATFAPIAAPDRPRAPLEVPRFSHDEASAVAATFTELPPPDRASLAELLEAKESFVRGDLDATLERVRTEATQRTTQRFGSSYRTMVVLSAGATGDRALVESLLGGDGGDGALEQLLRDLPWLELGGGSISVQFGFGTLGEWPRRKPEPPQEGRVPPAKERSPPRR
ncbi:MAG: zf-HC2 domain-containing protein [Planctomycetes bacterium]|nr:zf-HC2 domain-containing protein [Planctomycetota bacterium]